MKTIKRAATAAEWQEKRAGLLADVKDCQAELAGIQERRAPAAIPAFVDGDPRAQLEITRYLQVEHEIRAKIEGLHGAVAHCDKQIAVLDQARADTEAVEHATRIRAASDSLLERANAVDGAARLLIDSLRAHWDASVVLQGLLPLGTFPNRIQSPASIWRLLKHSGLREFLGHDDFPAVGAGMALAELDELMVGGRWGRVSRVYPDGRIDYIGGEPVQPVLDVA